jgi:phosphoribosylformylglycinamidine synthase PurS subunit
MGGSDRWAAWLRAGQLVKLASNRRARANRPDRPTGCKDWEVAVRLVPLFRARVQVSLRPSVLDPAGEAARAAAARLGVTGIQRLRIGKAIEVELEAPDRDGAKQQLELLSDRLLANPVIEDWTLDVVEAPEPA